MHFKKLFWYRILIMFSLLSGLVFAEENFIRNGEMEQGEGNPANWGMWGWQMKSAIFKLENGAAHGGNRFATIINNENNDSRFIQEILVEEGQKYKISGWIKTEEIGTATEARGAAISLLEDDKIATKDIKGTNDKWEYVEFYLEIGKNVRKITVSLCVGGVRRINTGRASFDDVKMEAVTAVPKNTKIVKYEIVPEGLSSNAPVEDISQENLQPAVKQPWYTNPLLIVVLILIAVIIAAVVILVFAPKEKSSDTVSEEIDENPKKE